MEETPPRYRDNPYLIGIESGHLDLAIIGEGVGTRELVSVSHGEGLVDGREVCIDVDVSKSCPTQTDFEHDVALILCDELAQAEG
ncbi:MAG: hypothetical protein VX930_14010, partial [Pseudomonadota bacterium]|nr:hypothetical protein [Pseudomonadota bacterium]